MARSRSGSIGGRFEADRKSTATRGYPGGASSGSTCPVRSLSAVSRSRRRLRISPLISRRPVIPLRLGRKRPSRGSEVHGAGGRVPRRGACGGSPPRPRRTDRRSRAAEPRRPDPAAEPRSARARRRFPRAAIASSSTLPIPRSPPRSSSGVGVVLRTAVRRRRSTSLLRAMVKTHARRPSSSPWNRRRPVATSSQTSDARSSASPALPGGEVAHDPRLQLPVQDRQRPLSACLGRPENALECFDAHVVSRLLVALSSSPYRLVRGRTPTHGRKQVLPRGRPHQRILTILRLEPTPALR